jgi:hypothetical protein
MWRNKTVAEPSGRGRPYTSYQEPNLVRREMPEALKTLLFALQAASIAQHNSWEQALWMLVADFLSAPVPILPFVLLPVSHEADHCCDTNGPADRSWSRSSADRKTRHNRHGHGNRRGRHCRLTRLAINVLVDRGSRG